MPRREFFYLDKDGQMQDRELHDPILKAFIPGGVDQQKLFQIRAKNRKKWIEGQGDQTSKARGAGARRDGRGRFVKQPDRG